MLLVIVFFIIVVLLVLEILKYFGFVFIISGWNLEFVFFMVFKF